jgi:hypothetical protein
MSRPVKIGDKVVLAPDFASHADASGGPLKLGDVGDLFEDDGSSLPCHVRFGERKYWYEREALRVAPVATETGATAGGARKHRGEWRGSSTRQWCSRPGEAEGELCAHGEAIIQEPHWSCCGKTDGNARFCVKKDDRVKRGPHWKVRDGLVPCPGIYAFIFVH